MLFHEKKESTRRGGSEKDKEGESGGDDSFTQGGKLIEGKREPA